MTKAKSQDLIEKLRSSAKAFRENPVYDSEGDGMLLTVQAAECEEAADFIEHQAAENGRMLDDNDDLRVHLGRLISLYDASDFRWGGARGFADGIDNEGKPYESSALATAVEHARAALGNQKEQG